MAQVVRLRGEFNGNLVPKVSSQSIKVVVDFDYMGPAQVLDIESSSGKKGLFGDYDQESPVYHDPMPVSESSAFARYTFTRDIPLSFWGSRKINDCAVEVVIRGTGVYADAVIWNAYTVNL